ncbi:carboxypeptidase-like regulatory domain-containing protein, partial [Klebsiella pneumoniae]|nr:carboxypeptidase-like regulatory domain-containing protein [Klebsiella pneumoniae]
AKVGFTDSDISTYTKEDGSFSLETYYASDTLVVSVFGYKTVKQKIQLDQSQEVIIYMEISSEELDEVVIRMTGDTPSLRILKRVIRNKPV